MDVNATEFAVTLGESINWTSAIIGIVGGIFAIYIWLFTKKDKIGRGTEYTHSFESKESYPRKIMVGRTYDKKDILIMTVYEVKRKSRQI